MKHVLVFVCLAFAAASCNNATETSTDAAPAEAATVAAAPADLPFPLATPYMNWQMNDNNNNTIVAMNCLKHFIDQDYTALAGTLGDSVELDLEGYSAKLSRDSVIKMFSEMRPQYADLTITMSDYESVISADKKEEYVTLWYKQAWKDTKGVADSMVVVDDVKMKDGKVIGLDEKVRRFPAKK